jgi:hypothetical protein
VHPWYIQGTLNHDLLLYRVSTSNLIVYTDGEWVGCPDTHQSTSGYAVFLGDNFISWSSKHENVVSRSSAEAEYHAMVNDVAEMCWLRQLLVELYSLLSRATLVYCARERVAVRDVRVLHVSTTSQFTDIFTKELLSSVFLEFRSNLNIYSD